MKIHDWLRTATTTLAANDIPTARLDALVMLEDATSHDRAWLLAHPEYNLPDSTTDKLGTLIKRRADHEPLAYIRGKSEFYAREFVVTPDVLIPRPESEAVIDLLKKVTKAHDINTVIDAGTGSGCLAISVKQELPDVHVTGVDISSATLKVAQKNARVHQVQIQWKQMDILAEGLPRMPKTRPYAIIANLPYVPTALVTSPEITKEPHQALFSGKDGLDHYRGFFKKVGETPNKPIALITEALPEQHDSIAKYASNITYILAETHDFAQLFLKA